VADKNTALKERWDRARDACAAEKCVPSVPRWHSAGCLRRAAYNAGFTEKELENVSVCEVLEDGERNGFVLLPRAVANKIDGFLTDPSTGFMAESRPQTGWRTDTKEAFDRRLKMAREAQAEQVRKENAKRSPWWKFWGSRG
jgi:hypothetical protein